MIGFFGEDVPQLLQAIETGLENGDATAIKRAAHSVKGLAAGFDAERVVRQTLAIERAAEDNLLDQIPSQISELRRLIKELEAMFAAHESE